MFNAPWTKLALLALATGVLFAAPVRAQPVGDAGEAVFQAHCKMCHEPPIERAPSRPDLAKRPRADVVTALTSGIMAPMAKGLSPGDIVAVAAYLTPGQDAAAAEAPRRRPVPTAGVDQMCAAHTPIGAGPTDWSTIGRDADASRYQPHPGFSAADIPTLKVKWSMALAGGGQVTVTGKWLFVTDRSGRFRALDADTGCVHWTVTDAVSRTTPNVVRSPASPSGWLTVIGLADRTVRAFDAQTGRALWRSEALETHPASGVTGAPIVAGDRVFVPLSSGEEGAAIQKTYPCCSFRGSVAALDLKTGRKLWQTSMITEPLRPTRKTELGVQLQGPAGAAIWSAPTADLKRGLVYVATGDSYTDAETKGDDAIVALDMKTGRMRWSTQVTLGDNYTMGCEAQFRSPNCPHPRGPDYDFGASPVLHTLKGGRQILLAGQKSGIAYGLDPATGKLLWKSPVGSGSALGGLEWGIASDPHHLYVAVADTALLFAEVPGAPPELASPAGAPPAKPGVYALDPATGRIVWGMPAPKAPCHYAGDRSGDYTKGACIRAQSSPPSAMPGAVFEGGLDGWVRAYDAVTGRVLWAFSTTDQTYDTANGVKGQPGGGIDGMGGGPVIANGMVYMMSGFNGASRTGGNGVNVLLAFSPGGR